MLKTLLTVYRFICMPDTEDLSVNSYNLCWKTVAKYNHRYYKLRTQDWKHRVILDCAHFRLFLSQEGQRQ